MDELKDYIPIIQKVPLFKGTEERELLSILNCLNAQMKNYGRNSFIYTAGDGIFSVGIVLSGIVQILKEDIMGNSTIMTVLESGELFGETFVSAKIEKIPVTVLSVTESRVLFIDYARMVQTCTSACAFHSRLIENMLSIVAEKNLMLNQKIEFLSKRTTRDKLLAFLSLQAQKTGKSRFTIPFNREELADYLCVDRSAMSKELCRMRDEGLLDFQRSHFELHLSE